MINPLAEQPLDPRFFTAAAAALSAGLSRHMAPEVTILMGTTGGAGAQTDQLWQGPLSAAARGPEDVRARMMDLIAAYKVAKGLPVPEDLSQLHCTLAPLQARDYKMYILQATPQPNAEAVAGRAPTFLFLFSFHFIFLPFSFVDVMEVVFYRAFTGQEWNERI